MDVVALCEKYDKVYVKSQVKERWGSFDTADHKLTFYTDYDKFLEHDMDAVILANYATEHTAAAIKALKAGKHVLSECMACYTMGEAVELAEAVEASGLVYMFAENYPYSAINLEMRRRYEAGDIGEFKYGECSYIHPATKEEMANLRSSPSHWRVWNPVTYYCTHSMGPVMKITGLRPVKVSGLVIPYDFNDAYMKSCMRTGDYSSVLMCTMENGALARIIPCSYMRTNALRTNIIGATGSMNVSDDGLLQVYRPKAFNAPNTITVERYAPNFPEYLSKAVEHGHGGGDFCINYYFRKAIEEGGKPEIDVYQGLDMTVIGILGYMSAHKDNVSMEVPDFRKKEDRDKWRGNRWSARPETANEPGMPKSSVLGDIPLTKEALEFFHEYTGQ